MFVSIPWKGDWLIARPLITKKREKGVQIFKHERNLIHAPGVIITQDMIFFYTWRQLLYDTVMITVVLLLAINIITSVALCNHRRDLSNIVCSVLIVSIIIIIIIKLKNQHSEELQGRFNLSWLKGKYMHHLLQH